MRILYANRKSWEILKVTNGKVDDVISPEELLLLRSFRSLVHVDSIEYLNFIHDLIVNGFRIEGIKNASVYSLVFYYDIWKKPLKNTSFSTIDDAIAVLNQYKFFKNELSELLFALRERVDHIVEPILETKIPGLFVHAHYTRDQLLALAKHHTPDKMYSWREGTLHLSNCNCSLMMVTLNKSEKDFSPSIQYEDYAVSESLFHWQSQNATRVSSETGQTRTV